MQNHVFATGLAFFFSLFGNLEAKQWFVSNSGSNSNSGTSSSPLETIQAAIDSTSSADTVILKEGTYSENLNLPNHKITIGSLWLVDGSESHISKTIIDGSGYYGNNPLFNTTNHIFHIIGLTVSGAPKQVVQTWNKNGSSIRKCVIYQCGNNSIWGVVALYGNTLLDSCTFDENYGRYIVSNNGGQTGMLQVTQRCTFRNNGLSSQNGGGYASIFSEGRIIIRSCLFYNNNSACIATGGNGGVDSAIIVNNTLVNNKSFGITFENWGGGTLNILHNNIIQGNKYNFAFNNSGYSVILMRNNWIYPYLSGSYGYPSKFNFKITNFGQDTVSALALNSNFSLPSYSSAIGIGYSSKFDAKDILGLSQPSPSGSKLDLGCFENTAGFAGPYIASVEGGEKQANLTWTQSSFSGLKYFKIYRSTSPISDTATVGVVVDTLWSGRTTYKDSGLTNLTKYYYRMKSINTSGVESGMSNQVEVRPNTPPNAPDSSWLFIGPRKLQVNWNTSSSAGVKYNIYRKNNNGIFVLLASNLSSTKYLDTSLIAWKEYSYRIKAVDSVGVSSIDFSEISGMPNRVFFVSPTGTDYRQGGFEVSPFKTGNYALSHILANDTIILLPGRHKFRLDLTGKNVTIASKFLITGDPSYIEKTRLGTNFTSDPLIYENGWNTNFYRSLIGFTIDSIYAPAIWGVSRVSISDMVFSKISSSNWIGLINSELKNSIISKNTATNGVDVIDFWDSCKFSSCKVYDNYVGQRLFKLMPGNGKNITIEKNLIYNNEIQNFSDIEGSGTLYFSNNILTRNKVGYLLGIRSASTNDSSYIFNNYFDSSERLVHNYSGAKGLFVWRNNIIGQIEIAPNNYPYYSYEQRFVISEGSTKNGLMFQMQNNAFIHSSKTGQVYLKPFIDIYKVADTAGSFSNFYINRSEFKYSGIGTYQLSTNSKLLGVGSANIYLKDDFYGKKRPQPSGTRPEIGPVESVYFFPSPIITKSEGGEKQANLTWTQSSFSGLKYLKIYRSTSPISDTATVGVVVDTLWSGRTTYKDSGLTNLTKYYYRMKSINSSGVESGMSNQVEVRPNTPPNAPDSIQFAFGPRIIDVSWSKSSSSSVVKYALYRKTLGNEVLVSDTFSKLSFRDTGLVAGQKYIYRVLSIDSVGVRSTKSKEGSAFANKLWYVSNSGDNNNLGSKASPLKTIANAFSKAWQGDSIILLNGTYKERINFTGKTLHLASEYAVDGNESHISATHLNGLWTSNNLIYDNNITNGYAYRSITGLTIDSTKGSALYMGRIVLDHVNFNGIKNANIANLWYGVLRNCEFVNSCTWTGNVNPLMMWDSCSVEDCLFDGLVFHDRILHVSLPQYKEVSFKRNTFINNKPMTTWNRMVWVEGNGKMTFANNLIIDKSSNQAYGFHWSGNASTDTVYILNNTIIGGRIGLWINANGIGNVVVENNLFSPYSVGPNNGIGNVFSRFVYLDGNGSGTVWMRFRNNHFDTTSGFALKLIPNIDLIDTTGSKDNWGGRIAFNNPSANDYTLRSDSRDLGAGVAVSSWLSGKYDVLGKPRVQPSNSNPDLGAYENAAAFPSPVITRADGGEKQANLTWTQSSFSGLKYFKIYRSTSPISDTATVGVVVDTLWSGRTTYKDSGLTNLTKYYYRMKSINTSGVESGMSNQVEVRPNTPPNAPDSLKVENGPRMVRLSWKASTSVSVKYRIYRGTTANNLQVLVDTTSKLNYIDQGLTAWKAYYYAVRAIDTVGVPSKFSKTEMGLPNNIWWADTNANNGNLGFKSSGINYSQTEVDALYAGDTLILASGKYTNPITIKKSLTLGSEVLISKTWNSAVVKNTIIDGMSKGIMVKANQNTYSKVRLIGLTFDNCQSGAIEMSSIDSFNRSKIYGCRFINSGNNSSHLISLYGNMAVDSCYFYNNIGNALIVGNHQGPGMVRATRNVFENNGNMNKSTSLIYFYWRGAAIGNIAYNNIGTALGGSCNGPGDTIVVENNTFVRNTYGLYFDHCYGGFIGLIRNNIIENNSDNCVLLISNTGTGFSRLWFINNKLDKNTVYTNNPKQYDCKFINCDTSSKYYFTYPISSVNDLVLNSYSQAIGAGVKTNYYFNKRDVFNTARPTPVNSNSDLGAIESKFSFQSPYIVTAEGGEKQANLTWTQSSFSGLKYFKIYRSTSPISDTATVGVVVDTLWSGRTTYKDSGLTNLTKYYYRMKSINTSGVESGMSNQVEVRPNTPPNAPDSSWLFIGPRKLQVNWNTSSSAGVKYNIYRKNNNGIFVLLASNLSSTKYLDTSLIAWKEYSYRIKAVDSVGVSSIDFSEISGMPNRVFFVSPTGTDYRQGGFEVSPFKTGNYALSHILANDTIILLPGRHKFRLDLTGKNVTIASKFLITGDPSYIEKTRLGTNFTSDPLIYENGWNTNFYRSLIGFTIDSIYAPAIWGVSRVSISDMVFSKISSSNWIGLINSELKNSIISKNTATNGVDVIDFWDSCKFSSCKVYDNYVGQRLFKLMPGNGKNITIEKNLIYNNEIQNFSDIEGSGTLYFSNNILTRNKVGYLLGIRSASTNDSSYIFNNYFDSSERLVHNYSGAKGLFVWRNNIIGQIEIAPNNYPYYSYEQRFVISEGSTKNGLMFQMQNNAFIHSSKTGQVYLKPFIDIYKVADTAGSFSNFYINRSEFKYSGIGTYQLSTNSKLLGVGSANIYLKDDFYGKKRPQPSGTRPEIGPVESVYFFPSPIITKSEGGEKQANLTWTQSSFSGLKYLKIYRSTSPISDTATVGVVVDTLWSGRTTYKDSGLTNLTKYYYRMKSINSSGVESGMSNQVEVRPNTPPNAPDSIQFAFGPRIIDVSWSKSSSSSVVKYALYRKTLGNEVLVSDTFSKLSFRDTGLVAGQKYIYRVLSIDSVGVRSTKSKEGSAFANKLWYVSNSGDNNNLGSKASPLKTIANAFSKAWQGDSIILLNGTYKERINFTGKTLHLASEYAVDGNESHISATHLNGLWTSNNLIYDNNITNGYAYRSITGLTIDSTKGSALYMGRIVLDHVNFNGIKNANIANLWYGVLRNCEFVNSCTWTGNVNPLMMWDSCSVEDCLFDGLVFHDRILHVSLPQYKEVSFKRNTFINNKPMTTWNRMVWVEGNGKMTFANNLIIDKSSNQAYGFHWSGNASTDTVYILNNTIIGGRIGLWINANGIGNVVVENNLFSPYSVGPNNGIGNVFSRFVYLDGNGSGTVWMRFRNNHFDTTSGFALKLIPNIDLIDTTGSKDNWGGRIAFNNPSANDYTLRSDSRDLGAGVAVSSWLSGKYDVLGKPRVQPSNSNPDLGAYENAAAFPSPVITRADGGEKQANLTWTQSSFSGLKYFKIYRSTSPISDTATVGVVVDTLWSGRTTYKDSGLTNLTKYYYRMKSINTSGVESGMSNQVEVRPNTPPNAPDSIKVINGPHRVQLNWPASSTPTVKYQILRTASGKADFLVSGISNTSYEDTTVEDGIVYTYKVAAIDSVNVRSLYTKAKSGYSRRIWFVSSSGKDSIGYGYEYRPTKTIQYAINRSTDGDTVLLEKGTYKENVIYNGHEIVLTSRFALTENYKDRDSTIIDGNQAGCVVRIKDSEGNNTELSGLVIQNGYSNSGAGIYATANRIKFKSLIVRNNTAAGDIDGGGAYIMWGKIQINDCEFYGNKGRKGGAIALGANTTDTSWITNCNFHDNDAWEAGSAFHFVSGNANKVFVYNSIIHDEDGQSTIWCQTPVVRFVNCAIVNNTPANTTPVNYMYTGTLEYYNCIIRNPGMTEFGSLVGSNPGTITVQYSNVRGGYSGTGNTDVDPLFISGTYQLSNASPSLGKGGTGYLVKTDILGKPRPMPSGSNPDLGAYENAAAFPSPVITRVEGGEKQANLTWTQSSFSGLKYFKIYRSTSPISDTATVGIVVDTLWSGRTTYKDSGLTNLTKYYYRMKSINTSGVESGMSNQVEVRPNTPPNAPSNLKFVPGPHMVGLTWKPSTSSNVSYVVYRASKNEPNAIRATTIDSVFMDNQTQDWTGYTYQVRAMDTVGVKSTSFIEVKAFANKIWYIDTAGNDSNGFKGHPWFPAKNYQKLVDISSFKSGDTILLKPGVYKTNIDVAHSNGNYTYKDMTIGSYYMINGDTNVIRKTVLDGSSYFGTNAFIQVGQSKFNLIGLTVHKTNAQALQYNSAHKALSTVKRVKFLNCGNSTVWGTVAIWGYVRIDSCEFLGSKGRYLVAQGSSTSIIRNSTFINNGWNQTQDCGVIFSERGGQVYNNIITGNGMPALVLGGNAALDTVLWIHNTIYNNNSYGLYFQNWGGGNIAYIENNIVEGNKPNAYFNNSGFSYLFFSNNFIKPFLGDSATNKNAYPMPLYYKFSQNNVDSVSQSYLPASIKNSSDLKLGAYSPLLGMGKSTYVKTDMIGQSRPNPTGSSPDLGALESAYELPGPYIDSVRTLGDTVYTYVKVLRPDKSNYLYTRYYDTAGTQKGLDSTKLSASKTNYVVKNYSLSNGRLYTVQSDLNKSSICKSNIRKVAIMVKPDMYSPSNQATMVDTAKSLKWWPSPYAQKYRVQLSSSSTFATTLLDRIVSGDSVKPSGLKLNRTYYWRTLSIDSQGRSLWSNAFKYQTEVQKARIDSLRYSPSTVKLHFSIQDTFNVAKFYVYRDTSANAFDLIDSVSASARIFVDSFVKPGLRYYYRLKVVNKQGVVSNFGPERAINILKRPVLSSPLEEQDSVAWTSSFTWTKAPQAQKSEFELYRWEGSRSLISQKVLNTDTITVASLKQNRYHTWRVRALDSCGRSEWSDTFRIQTKVAATKITQVKSYVAHIDLTWQLADTFNVKDYVIYRDTIANGLTVLDSVTYTGTSYRDSSLTAGVRYYYQIRVSNRQGSMSDPSLMRSASVLEAPILVKPVNLKTNESRSPMHYWKTVKYATKYRVQVASDSQMVNILANSLQTPDSFAMSNLKYSTYYYWKVRAEDSTGYGAWSERRVYQTQVQTPVLTSLNSKETQVEVKWTLADTTNAGSFVIYRDTFANPTTAIDSVPSWKRNYFDNSAQEDTRYFYRVALKNKQSVYGPKSNQKAINVLIKASIAMPLNKELNVSVGPLFDWNSERFANKYRIQVSQDPNFGTKAKDTAVSYSSASLATFKKNTNYYWRVRCEDSLGYGRWSDTFMYQTELDVPVLFTLSTTHKAIKFNWKLYDTTNYANLAGFYIYRDTAKDASVLIDSVAKGINTFTDTTVTLATMNYYRIKAYNKQWVKSEYSNEKRAAALHYPDFVSPIDTAKRVVLSASLKWTQERYATKYRVQVSYDSAVANPFFDKTLNNVDSTLISLNRWNYFYYWRVRAEDSLGISRWSDVFEYQTKLFKPSIDTTVAGNKKIRLTWQRSDTQNIKEYKIYRDTTANNPKYIATVKSVDGKLSYTYLDSGLVNFKTYYYWITAVNNQHVESDRSAVRFNTTFNISPFAHINKDTLFENVGRNSRVKRYFLQTAAYDKDGWVDSIVWYVDDIRVAQDDSLKYMFRQGTTKVRAVVFDNDQATDTNTFYVSQLTYRKKFRTGIVAGVSVFNENEIYVADTSLNSFNLGEVLRIDTLGNTTFNYLVSDRIRTTPSFDYSGNMFLTNGVNLNSFTNSGAPLFNEMALGGLSFVTPTVDSVLGRVYVGVSNRKLFAIDVDNGGKIKWDFTADAPMAAPAVVTAGRKLIFPDVSGKLYGFDVTYSYSPKTGDAPKWKWTGSDSIMLAPAIDTLENVIVGTTTGKLLKLEFDSTGKINTKWSTNLGSKITTSAVLDAYGRIYVGCKNGYLYCLKSSNGDTLWSFNTGATILSTPTLSDQNRIYVANMNGHVYALDTGRKIMWFYLGNEPVQSHLVHVNGATYIPTLRGSLKTIYDAGILNDISTIKSQVTPRGNKLLVPKPIWGTYQGNYRRTGLQDGIFKVVPDKPADQSSVRVYPNPSSNFFRLESLFGVRTVEFLDISGRSVETLNLGLATQSVIDVASYRPGIYFLKVSTEKGMVTKRVVITH